MSSYYEQKFQIQFLQLKATAFQDFFVAIMSKAHPGDFAPCLPWGPAGDRKSDGYLKSERTLFQVYAPKKMHTAQANKKIETDFTGALSHWREHFDKWVFVHNNQGGLPADIRLKLLDLENRNKPIVVTDWGLDELLVHFRLLSPEALVSLYGAPPPASEKKPSAARSKLKLAQELKRDGKGFEAFAAMTEALAISRAEGNEEEEVEILVALALSSSRRGGQGDRQHYFHEAEKKVDKLKSSAVKVIYFRARAASLEDTGELVGAEEAYREAMRCCADETDDEKGNLATQACVVRSSFVHFLCNAKRFDEARPLLAECEEYARRNSSAEEGELLHAALEAGIHFSIETDDEEGVIQRIAEFEKSASTIRLAAQIAGDLINIANRLSHRSAHRSALAAAEASVRLGRRCQDKVPNFMAGALYTEAVITFAAGDCDMALSKSEAILDVCSSPEDAAVRQAAQHLISEIKRIAGDSQTAVDLARMALKKKGGRPEDVAFTKCALARALYDNGQTQEALEQTKEAWTLAEQSLRVEDAAELLFQIANYASQLGIEADIAKAAAALDRLPADTEDRKTFKTKALAHIDSNRRLRERFLEIPNLNEPTQVIDTAQYASLPEANAAVVRELVRWWDDVLGAEPEFVGGAYEAWAHGNFVRILRNAREYPTSFNITVEVRSLDDVKRAIRIWGLYVDFLVLLWKGPTQTGFSKVIVPQDYEGPGGWGCVVFGGTVFKKEGSERKWVYALNHASTMPAEVAVFLATEAREFVRSGRLLVVPAIGAGCISPGHGPFEQLLAETANAIPSVRLKGDVGIPIGLIPYSPDAPFGLLAEIASAEAMRLRKLRLLLLERSHQPLSSGEIGIEAKMLSLKIDDALRDMEDKTKSFTQPRGFGNTKEPIAGTTARFRSSGKSVAGVKGDSPFAPLLVLRSLGFGWRVDSSEMSHFPSRFEPKEDDAIGSWLAPPTFGWRFAVLDKNGELTSTGPDEP